MARTIKLEDGSIYEILDELGDGGQGVVFQVRNQQSGKMLALKVYKESASEAFIENLRTNIIMGAPNQSFLWPQGLTEPLGSKKDRYGYVMKLYNKKEYSSFPKLIKGRVAFPSKEIQLATLIDLVDAFELLHVKGYSYQDLNDGGVVIDCTNGKILICDNDNVSPYGVNLGILGKFKYMAPEVAIKMFLPDTHSDRFSLAVLMFLILLHAHPFDGIKRLSGQLTPQVREQVYGTEPVFIFHPTDKSNRPDSQLDENAIKAWPMLPEFIQALFIKTFTSGMPSIGKTKNDLEAARQQRATESHWREAIYHWLDTMVTCPHCGFSICAKVENNIILEEKCPHCLKKVKIKLPILQVKRNGRIERSIILEDGKQISKSSVTNGRSNDAAFIVEKSPRAANVYGIKNLLPYQWRCSQTGAATRLVNTNEFVAALDGVTIEFDYTYSGEIFYSRN